MSLEEEQEELIKLHLDPSNFLDGDAVASAAFLFSLFEEDFVKKVNDETFYVLPYKDISIYVYECGAESIQSNTLNGFATTVKEFFINKGLCADAEHMVKCYEKFIDHILLAFAQKNFMLKVSSSALDIAQKAESTAKKSKAIALKADRVAIKADGLAMKADGLATKAERLANEADAQAKSTIANYISILGIFASIIFTLFGGVNLIGATVKLLEANSRLPYLTFIVALLMICLLTLLNMMIKWINSMNNLKAALDRFKLGNPSDTPESPNFLQKYIGFGFYTRAVLVLGAVLGASLIGMYNVKKENIFNYSTETTTRHPIDKKSSEEQNQDEETNLNKETTVVSKFTLSNTSKDFKDEKKED